MEQAVRRAYSLALKLKRWTPISINCADWFSAALALGTRFPFGGPSARFSGLRFGSLPFLSLVGLQQVIQILVLIYEDVHRFQYGSRDNSRNLFGGRLPNKSTPEVMVDFFLPPLVTGATFFL